MVSLPQRVFDIQPIKILDALEMEAIFAPTPIHISKILLESSLWDT